MKESILLELAHRWEQEARVPPDAEEAIDIESLTQEGAHRVGLAEGKEVGSRETKRECADTLRTLIAMLGEK